MRSEADLNSALAFIADEAEAHLEATSALSGGRPRRRRGPVLVAVAAVAVLALGGVWLRAQFATSGAAPVGTSNADSLPMRSQLFVLPNSPRLAAARTVDVAPGDQSWSVSVDGSPYTIDVSTVTFLARTGYAYPNVDVATAHHFDVNGRTGYLGCGGNSSDPPDCSSQVLTLAWQFDGQSWAQIVGQRSAGAEDRMLWLARAMDFAATSPWRVPVSISSAPGGYQLAEFVVGLPREDAPAGWSFSATYSPPGAVGEKYLTVEVSSFPVPTDRPDGEAITVDGRSGWWSASNGSDEPARLWVDAGHGKTILLLGDPRTDRTLTDFEDIARTVQLASNPDDRSGWFNAEMALP